MCVKEKKTPLYAWSKALKRRFIVCFKVCLALIMGGVCVGVASYSIFNSSL